MQCGAYNISFCPNLQVASMPDTSIGKWNLRRSVVRGYKRKVKKHTNGMNAETKRERNKYQIKTYPIYNYARLAIIKPLLNKKC